MPRNSLMSYSFWTLHVFILCAFLLTSCSKSSDPADADPHKGAASMQSGTATASSGTATTAPRLVTKSDSLAMKVLDTFGGHAAWAAVRYLRFDFGTERGGEHTVYRKHLWDRTSGDARIEWSPTPDSAWVILLNVGTKEGVAYVNGNKVPEAEQDSLVNQGFRAFVNDSFWLLAPLRLLEQGVERLHLPGWSDEETDVITAAYQSPDLAPDDQFWYWINKETSKIMRWAYVPNSNPEAGPIVFDWGEFESFSTDAGTIRFIPRKSGSQSDIITDNISVPKTVDDDAFTSPLPQL